jgi:hypothetical protein
MDDTVGMPPKTANARTPQQAQELQRRDAERPKEVVSFDDVIDKANAIYRKRYLEEIAPATFSGRLIKFNRDGKFVTQDDGTVISPDQDFVALCDETLIGWIKFNDDAPPDRHQGLLYGDFQMPSRESLGDLDESQWELGLDGRPQDPWLHQIALPIQNRESLELFSFVSTSKTGRRAVGVLLTFYNRMQRQYPDMVPIVRLKVGGFEHRDERIGRVSVPVFTVVGRADKASAARPDS